MIARGDTFTTTRSGVTGVVVDMDDHQNPDYIRLALALPDGSIKWTSAPRDAQPDA